MFKRFGKKAQEKKKKNLTIYLILRALVLLVLVLNLFQGEYYNVFLCALTLVLFLLPQLIERRFKIILPDFLEGIVYLFNFSPEILAQNQKFYGNFPIWDTMQQTLNGFMAAAEGITLIDILNRNKKLHLSLTPFFVAIVSFSFSMTIGVLWEFFEWGMDEIFLTDMQKDRLPTTISSVYLNPSGENEAVIIDNIQSTIITALDDADQEIYYTIDGGYLDIGLKDTMKDMFVNFIGAIVFTIIGYLYIKGRDDKHFAARFIPQLKK